MHFFRLCLVNSLFSRLSFSFSAAYEGKEIFDFENIGKSSFINFPNANFLLYHIIVFYEKWKKYSSSYNCIENIIGHLYLDVQHTVVMYM